VGASKALQERFKEMNLWIVGNGSATAAHPNGNLLNKMT
jgi:hypothetical protein